MLLLFLEWVWLVELFYKVYLMEGFSDFLLFCVIDSVFYVGFCNVYVNLCFVHGL